VHSVCSTVLISIRLVQNATTWAEYFNLLGVRRDAASVKHPVDAFATKLLRRAWQNSLKKGYHTKVPPPPPTFWFPQRTPS